MNTLLGIVITLGTFSIGTFLFKKTNGFFLFAPLFVATILGIITLYATSFSFNDYNEGGKIISFFLEPATICFAIPLYRKRDVLKKYWLQIIMGIGIGSTLAVTAIYFIGRGFHLDPRVIISMLPQAATTAVAMPVADSLGGVGELTSLACIINGVIIYALGSKLVKFFHINDPIARGLALGTSGHSLGVSSATELGEVETSMASIALVIVGVIVVVIVPIFYSIFF